MRADNLVHVVCVATPRSFFAIGEFYADFAQTNDREVTSCLERAAGPVVVLAGEVGAGPVG